MDSATPRPQSAMPSSQPARKRGPPAHLRIDTPSSKGPSETFLLADTPTPSSTLSSTTSDSGSFIFPTPSRPRSRNMKKLSLTLPSATSSADSPFSPITSEPPASSIDPFAPRRRSSTISLPTTSLLHRRDEDGDGSPAVPYADGPVQILPGIWLGNEDNARDWRGLMERGIQSILNVAKEVITSFDSTSAQPLRPFMSTPDLNTTLSQGTADPTYHPAHIPSGRPAMHYLKLPWSHGQSDLVTKGFPEAMSFVDQALERGDSVLIHCQCGVSRSATVMIAIVMRAAATRSSNVPPEVWALKGMQGAYSFVKEKSKWVGPNMSLIYQLLDYERSLKSGDSSPGSEPSSVAADEEEWARRRQLVEDADTEDNDRESVNILQEARALDKAMEDRRLARKTSVSSMCSSSSGIGMGHAWRNKYGSSRNRKGSIASVMTNGSVLSEDLVEEDEEEELLGVRGGFAETSCSSAEPTEDEASPSNPSADSNSPLSGSLLSGTPKARHYAPRLPPPSAPAHKASFDLPPLPATAIRTSFDITPRPAKLKTRKRPPPLISVLSPVPPSPVTPVHAVPPGTVRTRTEGRRLEAPPPQLRSTPKPSSRKTHQHSASAASAAPTQTLFVFPPSPGHTHSSDTPSTMTITSNTTVPFPAATTPCVSTFRTGGRRRSFIGVNTVATPTTASSRVDVRGWVGMR